MQLLQNILLRMEPLVSAFDQFYNDFENSPFAQFYKEYHQVTRPSYNLMGKKELKWINKYVSTLEGSLLELGCGLSPVAEAITTNSKISHHLGIDFSSYAIERMKEDFPQSHWRQSHFTFLKVPKLNHALCLDASYDLKRIASLVNHSSESFLLSRIHSPAHEMKPIIGYTQRHWDFTADYHELIISWVNFLEAFNSENSTDQLSFSWTTLNREMKRHYNQLEQQQTIRTVTLYEKIN